MRAPRLIAGLVAVIALVAGYFLFVRVDESTPAVGATASPTTSAPTTPREIQPAGELLPPRIEVDPPVASEESAPAKVEVETAPPAEPPKDTWPQTILGFSAEAWAKQHEGASRGLLESEAKRIGDYIVKTSQPEFDKRWNAGQATFIASGAKYDGADWDPSEVRRVYMENNTISKIVLPKDEFPDLYNLMAKMRWLQDASRDPQRPEH
jgi:hypothetical protein